MYCQSVKRIHEFNSSASTMLYLDLMRTLHKFVPEVKRKSCLPVNFGLICVKEEDIKILTYLISKVDSSTHTHTSR